MVNNAANIPSELAALHDIHVPERISFLQLAPIWYIVFGVLLILILTILYINWRDRSKHQALRQGIYLLNQLQQSQVIDPRLLSADVSNILRRVALAYYPRAQVAGLHGEEWLMFLNTSSHKLDFNHLRYELLELPYQESPTQKVELKPLFTIAHAWIVQRRKRCSN